jgi:hypothetical protein
MASLADALSRQADGGTRHKRQKPDQKHGPAPESVGQRPDDQLPQCHRAKIKRQGKLNGGEIHTKCPRHSGHRGQVHVDAQRAHGGDSDEQRNKARRRGRLNRCVSGMSHDFKIASGGAVVSVAGRMPLWHKLEQWRF